MALLEKIPAVKNSSGLREIKPARSTLKQRPSGNNNQKILSRMQKLNENSAVSREKTALTAKKAGTAAITDK